MSAVSYEVLYDFESQIEDAFAAVVQAKTEVPCFTQRSESELTEPRYEFQVSTGAATEHYGRARNGLVYPDGWRGVMRARVVSQRRDDFTLTQHRAAVAALRRWVYQYETYVNQDVLPNLMIESILETGTTPGLDAELELDITEIQFALAFYIRPSAWPIA